MTTYFAQTNIKHGFIDDNGESLVLWIPQDSTIPDNVSDDVVEAWLEEGTIALTPSSAGAPVIADLLEEKDARIAQLEEALKAANVDVPPAATEEPPAETPEDTSEVTDEDGTPLQPSEPAPDTPADSAPPAGSTGE
jgi:hypothetical protein